MLGRVRKRSNCCLSVYPSGAGREEENDHSPPPPGSDFLPGRRRSHPNFQTSSAITQTPVLSNDFCKVIVEALKPDVLLIALRVSLSLCTSRSLCGSRSALLLAGAALRFTQGG